MGVSDLSSQQFRVFVKVKVLLDQTHNPSPPVALIRSQHTIRASGKNTEKKKSVLSCDTFVGLGIIGTTGAEDKSP